MISNFWSYRQITCAYHKQLVQSSLQLWEDQVATDSTLWENFVKPESIKNQPSSIALGAECPAALCPFWA